jgi:regulator of cell morphogenesis and NO signaling
MNDIDRNATIGEMVSQRLDLSRVFEKYGLDYCCGGGKTITEACSEKSLDPEIVFDDLKRAEAEPRESLSDDYSQMSLGSLVDHIVETHHAYLKRELPRLGGLLQKVVSKHGETDQRLHEVQDVFVAFAAELESHWNKEEKILFPMIKSLESTTTSFELPAGMLQAPIRVMEHEHDTAGNALAKLRELTDSFMPPEFACNTYKAMLDAVARLETDTHLHIHKENNILFPRAIELEQKLSSTN